MKTSNFTLGMLILGTLKFNLVNAGDFNSQVENLKKNQSALDQMISPYRALSGFKDSQLPSNTQNEDHKSSILQFHNPTTQLQAQSGKLLFGKTVNRLVVGGEKNPVIIEIKSGQGSFSGLRAIGVVTQASTSGRLSIEIQKIVFKGGTTKLINGVALDQDGALGIEAQVISQKALSVAGAIASSFISGLAASQQTVSSNAFGFESTQRSSRNAILGGLAQTAADQSKRLIDESTSEKPVLILEANSQVTIMLQEEVRY